MPAIITDSFDYDDIVRVLDLDEAFVHHQIDALQPKYWRIVIKTKPKGLKIFAPVMVSGNRGIDYMIYMLSRDWQITKKQRLLDYMYFGVYRQTDGFHLSRVHGHSLAVSWTWMKLRNSVLLGNWRKKLDYKCRMCIR